MCPIIIMILIEVFLVLMHALLQLNIHQVCMPFSDSMYYIIYISTLITLPIWIMVIARLLYIYMYTHLEWGHSAYMYKQHII